MDFIKNEKPYQEINKSKVINIVKEILNAVKENGDKSIKFYENKFDDYNPSSYRVDSALIKKAGSFLSQELKDGLDFAIERVTAFATRQRNSLNEFESEMLPGIFMGQKIIPIKSCGCYIPAGRYPCATSAVMSVIPAKVAGVERIVACSPPGTKGHIDYAILYTLHKMGIEEIYCIGGAQAIGALAYGTQSIKPVDLIVGPGNQYVAEAKRQVFGTVGIDFLAGPSECMVIADNNSNPEYIAADLLAQCEHDPNARGSLVTTSKSIGIKTLKEIELQLKNRTTHEVAGKSWEDHGEIVIVDNLDEAVGYANRYAPEHLEIHTEDPRKLLSQLKNYGSLFLGQNTAEVYADKIAGTNHILPTGRNARFTGGLWVGMFLKVVTYQTVDDSGSLLLAKYAEKQAEYETMDCHRYAAAIRRRDLE